MKLRALLFTACLMPAFASGQWDTLALPFRAITIRDGLSQGLINHIAQDHHGFMWFATKDGLNRYDGYEFKVYRHDASDSNSVADSYITTLYVDRSGRLWVGTLAGLDLFDPLTDRFIHFPTIDEGQKDGPGLQGRNIASITEDPDGRLWVSCDRGLDRITLGPGSTPMPGACAYLPVMGTDEFVRADVDSKGRLYGYVRDRMAFTIDTRQEPHRVDTMHIDGEAHLAEHVRAWHLPLKGDASKDVELWYDPILLEDTLRQRLYGVHGHGVLEYEPGTARGRSLFRDGRLGVFMATPEPAVDLTGNIWMAGLAGLWRFDPDGARLTRILARDPNLAEMVHNVKVAYRDRNGLIWIGTSGYGILTYDPHIERFHTHPTPSVIGMAPAHNGQVIVNLRRGLTIFDPKTERFPIDLGLQELADRTNFTGELAENMVAVQDPEGIYWMNIGQLERYDHDARTLDRYREDLNGREQEFQSPCFPLHLDKGTRLWFGAGDAFRWIDRFTRQQGAIPFPIPVTHHPYLFLQAIHQDAAGAFWLATVKGLLHYDPTSDTWQHFASDPGDTSTLSHDILFSIEPDPREPERYLWIGTNGGGLNRFDKTTGRVRRWGLRDGLPNEVVYAVLADAEGALWMSTNKGIARYDTVSDTFRNYDASDGLQGDEFNRYAYCRTADGTLYFGGIGGFNRFHPAAIEQRQGSVNVRITDVRFMDRSLVPGSIDGLLERPAFMGGRLELPHGPNMITFVFAAMEFSAPGTHRYEYELEGFDADWVRSGTGNSAIYTNLDPGRYQFRVRVAGGRDDVAAGQATFELVVLPPWWSTWWSYLLAVGVATGAIVLVIRLRTAGLKRQKETLERTVALRTAELEREKEEAETQRLRAEHSGRIKQQFLANMSHEIRTPMNAIMGMTGILRRREHLPDQRKYLDAIAQSSEGLLVIINDILDLSRMEAGKIALETVPFAPHEVMDSVCNMLLPGAEQKGLYLRTAVSPDVPRTLFGDPARLQQVLMNLVGNAIKFTERGGVDVGMSASDKGAGGIALHLEVKDTGVGIPADRLDRIFEEFDQGQEATSFKYGGTGLGLSISKRLVEMMGGTIGVTSVEGRGSNFTVNIPFAFDGVPVNEQPPIDAAQEPPLKDLRILLAEDNAFNEMVARDELADAITGVRVDVAHNGSEAVGMVQQEQYDLVLMDVQMPVMNGYEATRAIRALPTAAGRIPIIAMTANVLKDEQARCTEAGMNGHIPKPFTRDELLGEIRRVLDDATRTT